MYDISPFQTKKNNYGQYLKWLKTWEKFFLPKVPEFKSQDPKKSRPTKIGRHFQDF